jgi:hypothetical protein
MTFLMQCSWTDVARLSQNALCQSSKARDGADGGAGDHELAVFAYETVLRRETADELDEARIDAREDHDLVVPVGTAHEGWPHECRQPEDGRDVQKPAAAEIASTHGVTLGLHVVSLPRQSTPDRSATLLLSFAKTLSGGKYLIPRS